MESSWPPGLLFDPACRVAPHLVRSVAGSGVSSQAKVVVGIRAGRQVPGGGAARQVGEGGGPGRLGRVHLPGRGAACSQARSCFRAAMQVQGGCRLKFLESPVFKNLAFLKKCPRRLMRAMVAKPGRERAGFRCQQNRSGCAGRNCQGFPGGSDGAMRAGGARRLVVAAVWVYRGSVAAGAKGIARQRRSIAAVIGRPG